MISIKHKTFKILNKYIEMNGFGKVQLNDMSRYYAFDDNFNEKNKQSDKNLLINNKEKQSLLTPQEPHQNNSTKKFGVKSSKFKIFKNSSKSQTHLIKYHKNQYKIQI